VKAHLEIMTVYQPVSLLVQHHLQNMLVLQKLVVKVQPEVMTVYHPVS